MSYWWCRTGPLLAQKMACHLFGTKTLPNFDVIWIKIQILLWKMHLETSANISHFVMVFVLVNPPSGGKIGSISWILMLGLPCVSRSSAASTHWGRDKMATIFDIFKCIFLNENVWISIKISLKCICKGPINNILALVQIMACRLPGDKPLSEPMMVSLLEHIYVTCPQWVNIDSAEWISTTCYISISEICEMQIYFYVF